MSRTARPVHVQCASCGETKLLGTEARELITLWTAHRGGTLGDVRGTTSTGIYGCKACRPWDTGFPTRELLLRIREFLVRRVGRGPPTQNSLLA